MHHVAHKCNFKKEKTPKVRDLEKVVKLKKVGAILVQFTKISSLSGTFMVLFVDIPVDLLLNKNNTLVFVWLVPINISRKGALTIKPQLDG